MSFFLATGLRVVKVLFVGAAAIIADLVTPTAGQFVIGFSLLFCCLLLACVLAVASFIGAPPCVFIDQNPVD